MSKTRKSVYIKLALYCAASISIVLVLQLFSTSSRQNSSHFVRLFPPHIINGYKEQNLVDNNYYFAGTQKEKIILANYINPSTILFYNGDAEKPVSHTLPLTEAELKVPSDFHISLDSDYLIVNRYSTGHIFEFTVSDISAGQYKIDSLRSSTTLCVPTGDHSFVVSKYDNRLKRNVLARISSVPYSINSRSDLLEPQIDGFFSTDGMLAYDNKTKSVVFVYLYRNQFLCLDNNLNSRYNAHTIDTNAYAKIRIINIPSQDKTTIASPGFYVNRECCINDKWIFINSGVKADNEIDKEFRENSVIDVYNLKTGKYHFSFYIPNKAGKVSSLLINHDTLYSIQGKTMFAFNLDLSGIRS